MAHPDTQPENFLWRTPAHADAGELSLQLNELVLIDFGFSARCPHHAEREVRVNTGSPSYCSPEVALHGLCSQRSDSWSLGVVLYSLLTGTLPYPQVSHATSCRVTATSLPRHCHVTATSLTLPYPHRRRTGVSYGPAWATSKSPSHWL